jgi:hypothetical protein
VQGAFGELGDDVDDLVASSFVAWFNLERVGQERRAGTDVLSFRPEGPAFHDLAELRVSATGDGRIESLELRLAREFVDDRRNGMFARDLAKSLLRTVLDDGDLRSIGGLADEIEWGGTFDVPILMRGPGPPKPPEGSPSPAYRVFLGLDDRCEQALHRVRLVFENVRRPDPPLLRMTVTAQT